MCYNSCELRTWLPYCWGKKLRNTLLEKQNVWNICSKIKTCCRCKVDMCFRIQTCCRYKVDTCFRIKTCCTYKVDHLSHDAESLWSVLLQHCLKGDRGADCFSTLFKRGWVGIRKEPFYVKRISPSGIDLIWTGWTKSSAVWAQVLYSPWAHPLGHPV